MRAAVEGGESAWAPSAGELLKHTLDKVPGDGHSGLSFRPGSTGRVCAREGHIRAPVLAGVGRASELGLPLTGGLPAQ